MADAKVTIISKQTVQPSPRTNEGESMRRIHLTPWDLKMLPVHHIQKGVLFNKTPHTHFIANLFTSFSRALDHFYPFAGRLVTTTHDDDDSISISLDCTGDGAVDRWFPDSCPVPVHLPFKDHREFITGVQLPQARECAFDFSSENIRKLKAKANEEMDCSGNISSLQAVLAHLWRSICRARRLKPEEEITCLVLVGYRTRLSPPLPEAYIGNSNDGARTTALAGQVESKGLGWTAWQLNRSIAAHGDAAALTAWFESWSKSPSFMNFGQPNLVGTSSSPRFNVYGNDFGLGRPVAVRSGPGNKVDGKMTVFPGAEEGGMTFEICLAAEALFALLQDKEFMETVA